MIGRCYVTDREHKGTSIKKYVDDYSIVDLETTAVFVGSADIIEISALKGTGIEKIVAFIDVGQPVEIRMRTVERGADCPSDHGIIDLFQTQNIRIQIPYPVDIQQIVGKQFPVHIEGIASPAVKAFLFQKRIVSRTVEISEFYMTVVPVELPDPAQIVRILRFRSQIKTDIRVRIVFDHRCYGNTCQ